MPVHVKFQSTVNLWKKFNVDWNLTVRDLWQIEILNRSLILTFDPGVKVMKYYFLSSFLRLLYSAIFSKIGQAVRDLLQSMIFESSLILIFDLWIKVTYLFKSTYLLIYGGIF